MPPISPAEAASREVPARARAVAKTVRSSSGSTPTFSRERSQGLTEIVDFLGLTSTPRLRLVVHLGDSGLLQFFVARLVDFLGEGLRSRDAFPFEAIRQPMSNHLAGRAELRADELRFPHQRLKDNVFLALLIDEIAAPDLR